MDKKIAHELDRKGTGRTSRLKTSNISIGNRYRGGDVPTNEPNWDTRLPSGIQDNAHGQRVIVKIEFSTRLSLVVWWAAVACGIEGTAHDCDAVEIAVDVSAKLLTEPSEIGAGASDNVVVRGRVTQQIGRRGEGVRRVDDVVVRGGRKRCLANAISSHKIGRCCHHIL